MKKKRVYKKSIKEVRMPEWMFLLVTFNELLVFQGVSQCSYLTLWNQGNRKSKITFRHLDIHIFMFRLIYA